MQKILFALKSDGGNIQLLQSAIYAYCMGETLFSLISSFCLLVSLFPCFLVLDPFLTQEAIWFGAGQLGLLCL